MDHLGVEVESTDEVTAATARWPALGLFTRRERHHLLLRPAGQGLGPRPRRRAVGGLHRQGRRPRRHQHPPRRHHPGQPRLPVRHTHARRRHRPLGHHRGSRMLHPGHRRLKGAIGAGRTSRSTARCSERSRRRDDASALTSAVTAQAGPLPNGRGTAATAAASPVTTPGRSSGREKRGTKTLMRGSKHDLPLAEDYGERLKSWQVEWGGMITEISMSPPASTPHPCSKACPMTCASHPTGDTCSRDGCG